MSIKGKEYQMAIRIAGVIDKSFGASLTSANLQIKNQFRSLDKSFSKLDKGFDSIMSVGTKCFSVIAEASAAAGAAVSAVTGTTVAAAVREGSRFESSCAGVKKTVDATAEEYAGLREDILEMTRAIPSGATEIAEVMEIAGQLGIANESLTEFTETMINLGVSTNLSAEEAASALAKFANIVSMKDYGIDGISNWERLGSVVVDLGNNFATTEADIVSMATNLAATGSLAGLSEAQILALATAMSSVGIEAEKGGSTMSKLLKKMQLAVELDTESLEEYAAVAGMTGEQFGQVFREDAVAALSAFIDGLNDTERNGKSAIAILDEMGLNEIRLSNTILALAGGEGLMSSAIATANQAWEENSALAIEAGKRYETAESRVQIMRNALSELGITAYEELREPYILAVDAITDKLYEATAYLGGADGISKWMKNIKIEIPTLQRQLKKYGKPVFSFFGSLKDMGVWFMKNPHAIIGPIEGIGAALITYKIGSTLTHIVSALMSFSPTTWILIGVAGAITGVVTAIRTYQHWEQGLVDKNLAEHFGEIALSMEDIQKVAECIVSSSSLEKVKQALEEFGELEGYAATMQDAVSELNKANWKISIGMELTPDEQESYKQAITEYVDAAQAYALQAQYAVSLSLSVAFDEADLEGQDVAAKVNQFYADKYDELTAAGQKLNEAVTDAFNDGLLDIHETQVIANLQAEMARLEKELAAGEFDAQLSLLQMEYAGGGSLTVDSFQNLQEEIGKQVDTATEAYKEAYARDYAAIQAAYEAGGYLTEEEYLQALQGIKEEYLSNVGELQAQSAAFLLGTIEGQYTGEIDPAVENYLGAADKLLEEYAGYDAFVWQTAPVVYWNEMLNSLAENGFDRETRQAISQLLEPMQELMEGMEATKEQFEEMGIEVPEYMAKLIADFKLLDAMTNWDNESVSYVLGMQIADNTDYGSFYKEIMGQIGSNGFTDAFAVEEGVADAAAAASAGSIIAAGEKVYPAVEGVYTLSQAALDEYFGQGFEVEADVNIRMNPGYNFSSITGLNLPVRNTFPVFQNADGGIWDRPILTTFAERGPEAAIPIDGSRNAISLWEQTGRLLGMESVLDRVDIDSGQSPVIEYKPTLQFYGNAPDKEDLTAALKVSQDEFEEMMEKYIKAHGRVSF